MVASRKLTPGASWSVRKSAEVTRQMNLEQRGLVALVGDELLKQEGLLKSIRERIRDWSSMTPADMKAALSDIETRSPQPNCCERDIRLMAEAKLRVAERNNRRWIACDIFLVLWVVERSIKRRIPMSLSFIARVLRQLAIMFGSPCWWGRFYLLCR
jgi:hypothetical protein